MKTQRSCQMNSVILTSSSGDARAEAKSAILLWQHQHDGIQSKSNHIKNQLQHCPQMTSFNSILYFLKQAKLNIPNLQKRWIENVKSRWSTSSRRASLTILWGRTTKVILRSYPGIEEILMMLIIQVEDHTKV